MTDEERQELCRELSHAATRTDNHGYYGPLCGKAANEIERLTVLVQSDASGLIDAEEHRIISNEARRYSLYNDIIEHYQKGIRPVGLIDEFFGFPSMTAPPVLPTGVRND